MILTTELSQRIADRLAAMRANSLAHYTGRDAADDADENVTTHALTQDEIDLAGADEEGLFPVGRLDDYDVTVWLMLDPTTNALTEENHN